MFISKTNAIHAGYSTRKSPKIGYIISIVVIFVGTFFYISKKLEFIKNFETKLIYVFI